MWDLLVSKPKWHHKLNRICKNQQSSSSLKMCVCAYLCKQRGLSVHLHLYISGCVTFTVWHPFGRNLCGTLSPHTSMPWRTFLCLSVMVAVNSICANSVCTAMEQMWCFLDLGMLPRYLAKHGAVHFLHQKPMNWSVSCVMTWELRWICSAAVVSCCCCECKLSYQFKARRWGEAIYVACLILERFRESSALHPPGR